MDQLNGGRKRRVFIWPDHAQQLVMQYQQRSMHDLDASRQGLEPLLGELIKISGNPRDACLRFARQKGVKPRRQYREWTKAEQQKLLDLISSVPVVEAAKALRRPIGSVRSMLHRLEIGGRQTREWFTRRQLSRALHISADEVQRWINNGWLKCSTFETQGVKLQIIDPDDFCEFFKQYGREVVGRRLNYEGLWFVRTYVFPCKHADMLSVRGTYKKRGSSEEPEDNSAEDLEEEDGSVEQSA